ncbi:hypothetical protein [Kribbella lupini]|uniref:hypothetical protein n=1 Tax=Kribbella lupini TaxID=291602 RepID=UPI0031DEFE21
MTGSEARVQVSGILAAVAREQLAVARAGIGTETTAPAAGQRVARTAVARPSEERVVDRAAVERAIGAIDRVAASVDDEIERLSVLRMKESLRLLAGPAPADATSGTVLGLAAWDGSLVFDETLVLAPLQEMYEHPGERVGDEVLRRYRFSLSEMFHQQSHLLSEAGTSYGDSAAAFADPAVRLLELGVSAAWTARHLDEYVETLGVPEIAPGIDQVELPDCYPSYLPAAVGLSEAVGERIGVPADEVLRRLNVVAPASKLPLATTLLLTASGLAQVVPPADRAAVQQQVSEQIRLPLLALATLRVDGTGERALQTTAAASGRAAVDAGVRTIEQIRRDRRN